MKIKNNLRILLLSSPAVIGSFFLSIFADKPVQALDVNSNVVPENNQLTPPVNLNCNQADCTGNKYLAAYEDLTQTNSTNEEAQFPNVQRNEYGDLLLNVSEEESDAAVALYGCDCVKAINALRQARGIPIGVEGDRILPGPMIRPCTQRLPDA